MKINALPWLSGFFVAAGSVGWIVQKMRILELQEPFAIAVFIVGWGLLAAVFVLSNEK
jgi:hypothetical protein